MSRSRLLSVLLAASLLGACSYKPGFINEYKIDIQQGNVLTQDVVAQLKPGMTRDQVRYLLGTPMVTDLFHQSRWDYVYMYRRGQTGQVESRKFAVFFDADGRLERVGGDVVGADLVELNTPVAKSRLVDLGALPADAEGKPLPPREEPGWFRRFMDMIGL